MKNVTGFITNNKCNQLDCIIKGHQKVAGGVSARLAKQSSPVKGGQAADLPHQVPTYQGGASWRRSRRWGGFVMLLIAALSLSMTNPTPAHAAPSITLAQPTNPVNISVPAGGGIGVGGHTLTIKATGTAGYDLTMQASNSSLTNTKDSNQTIPTVTASTTNNGNDPVKLTANTWGYNFTTGNKTGVTDNTAATWLPIPATAKSIKTTTADSPSAGDSYYLTYGVNVPKVDNTMIKTGNYTTTITYTATAKIPAPTITKLDPNTAQLATTADSTTKLTITGTNLSTATKAWIDLDKDKAYDEAEKCTIQGTPTDTSLACNLPNGNTIKEGAYDVYVETQGGTSTAGTNTKFTYTPASNYNQSTSGDKNVTVEWDKNMIPVVYNSSSKKWIAIPKSAATSNTVSGVSGVTKWYSYTDHQWANAVTVSNPATYNAITANKEVTDSDIKGFWVYIPRYKYTVQTVDKKTNGTAKNFAISFQTTAETSWPSADDSDGVETADKYTYTHPAFQWNGKPIAGFWMGKFETTGTRTEPTVLPGRQSNILQTVGEFFTINKSIGVPDDGAAGGSAVSGIKSNGHNLSIIHSYWLKNSQWGAVAYLSASDYGAGVGNVQINAAYNGPSWWQDADGSNAAAGITGCGPSADGSTSTYLPTNQPSASNPAPTNPCEGHEYNTATGVLASTTNNVYGVYDMSGGAFEYVAGSYTTTAGQSSGSGIGTVIKPPYVDLYLNLSSASSCTWLTCGGAALYETWGWNGDNAYFVNSSYPWFRRGNSARDGAYAGVFASSNNNGNASSVLSSRAALVATPSQG